jgi:hypothetical protein
MLVRLVIANAKVIVRDERNLMPALWRIGDAKNGVLPETRDVVH